MDSNGVDRRGKAMMICDRLRALREEKKLSQGDIENRTGLLRGYISRVENGPHGSHSGDAGEDGSRARSAAVGTM
jgi:hypothetical protein